MTPKHLADSMSNHYDREVAENRRPAFRLSVNCVPGMTVDELALHARRPNGQVRVTQVGAIESAGFVIQETPGRRAVDGHCDVWYAEGDEELPDFEALGRLCDALGPSIRNPWRRRET